MQRRQFIKVVGFSGVALAIGKSGFIDSAIAADKALPAGATACPETDPVAAAIGYKQDGKKIDLTKYPQFKKDKKAACDNCSLYTKTNDGWGKCQMLTAGLVTAKGLCGSYNKKA